MIMMQSPPDLTAFCLAGAPVEVRYGFVAVDERHIDVFRAHGFAPRRPASERQDAKSAASAQGGGERIVKEQTP
jgi:hypothetical protein